MQRPALTAALTAVLLLAGLRGSARPTDVDVHVNIGIPAPPAVVFEHPPVPVIIPSTQVYYVPGLAYDFYRYDDVWYLNRGGYWYSARDYGGPFTAITYARVPHPIIAVPARYHTHPVHVAHPHGGPPGQMKKGGGPPHGHGGGKHGHH